jgi:hypothetical protein
MASVKKANRKRPDQQKAGRFEPVKELPPRCLHPPHGPDWFVAGTSISHPSAPGLHFAHPMSGDGSGGVKFYQHLSTRSCGARMDAHTAREYHHRELRIRAE